MESDIISLNTLFSNQLELAPNNPALAVLNKPYDMVDFSFHNLLMEEVNELRVAIEQRNDIEILDGAFDVTVIALNIAYKLLRSKGFSHEEATARTRAGFAEVARSNLSKINDKGEVIFNDVGKVQKPNSYSPPALLQYLDVTKTFN